MRRSDDTGRQRCLPPPRFRVPARKTPGPLPAKMPATPTPSATKPPGSLRRSRITSRGGALPSTGESRSQLAVSRGAELGHPDPGHAQAQHAAAHRTVPQGGALHAHAFQLAVALQGEAQYAARRRPACAAPLEGAGIFQSSKVEQQAAYMTLSSISVRPSPHNRAATTAIPLKASQSRSSMSITQFPRLHENSHHHFANRSDKGIGRMERNASAERQPITAKIVSPKLAIEVI